MIKFPPLKFPPLKSRDASVILTARICKPSVAGFVYGQRRSHRQSTRGLLVLRASRLAAILWELCLVHGAMSPSLTSYNFLRLFAGSEPTCTRCAIEPWCRSAFMCEQARCMPHHQSSESGPGFYGRRQIAPGKETGRSQEQGRSLFVNFYGVWKNGVI